MTKDIFARSEEAAGITAPAPKMPYGKGERVAQGGVARPWTGPRPWKEASLIPRAKGGPVSPSRLMKMRGSRLSSFMPAGGKRSRRGKKRIPV